MNYKETVFLPRTDFPMRAGLPKKEPEILEGWKQIDIYNRLREARADAELFVLHDGPPYANGQLHIGHALNKILKDVINSLRIKRRSPSFDSVYLITFIKQKLSKVRTTLYCDPSNKSFFQSFSPFNLCKKTPYLGILHFNPI